MCLAVSRGTLKVVKKRTLRVEAELWLPLARLYEVVTIEEMIAKRNC